MLGAEPESGKGEAFPVAVPGVEKILSSKTIGTYYTPELFHYLGFYQQVKRFGLPYASFLDAPWWAPQLHAAFDQGYAEIEAFQLKRGGGSWRGRPGGKGLADDG